MDPNTPQPGRIAPTQPAVKTPPVQGPANPSQPGRIPPVQNVAKPEQSEKAFSSKLINKIPGVSSAKSAVDDIKQIANDPAGAAANKAMGIVTAGASAADSKKRFNKALGKAHKNERAPTKPQYRVSLFHGGIIIGVCAAFDALNYIAGWFVIAFGVGEIVVVIIDPIFAIILGTYCKFRLKLPVLAHLPIYISIVCFYVIDNIPFINALWWLDGWYIVRTMRAEDRATHQQLVQTIEQERQEQEQQEWMENYQAQKAQEAQGESDQEAVEQEENEEEDAQQTESQEESGEGRMKPKKPNPNPQNPEWRSSNAQESEGPGRFETKQPANAYAADRGKLDKMASGAKNFTSSTRN